MKKENIYYIVLITAVVILFVLFHYFPSNKFKLISGGLFLIAIGIGNLLISKRGWTTYFEMGAGAIALLNGSLLPTYLDLLLLIFCMGILVVILGLLYIYKKRDDNFEDKTTEWLFRLGYMFLAAFLTLLAFTLIAEVMQQSIQKTISPYDYALFIIVSLISAPCFFLLFDNILRMIVMIMGSEIFPKVKYSSYYSFFLSLATIILIGGYFYLNNPSNENIARLMVVVGLAFFTSLAISNNLRELLKKNETINQSSQSILQHKHFILHTTEFTMKSVKIVVFVPLTHADKVREVIGKAGGGVIGNYDYCSFSTKGIGRFKPNDKANPHIGKANKLESVEEERIEFVCESKKAKSVIAAIKKVHPYEEVALDVYPLIDEEELR